MFTLKSKWEIYTNSHKIFGFFHLNLPNKLLSTLAIKKIFETKIPLSLISPPTIYLSPISLKPKNFPSSAATSVIFILRSFIMYRVSCFSIYCVFFTGNVINPSQIGIICHHISIRICQHNSIY